MLNSSALQFIVYQQLFPDTLLLPPQAHSLSGLEHAAPEFTVHRVGHHFVSDRGLRDRITRGRTQARFPQRQGKIEGRSPLPGMLQCFKPFLA